MLKTLSAALMAAGLVIVPALVRAPGSSAEARVYHRHHSYYRYSYVRHHHPIVWHGRFKVGRCG